MVAQRRPVEPHDPLDRAARDMRRHLELLAEGWDGGRIELVAGTNNAANPDQIDMLIKRHGSTRRWLDPITLGQIATEATLLAERWGNVYLSVGSYDQAESRYGLRWSRKAPRPRRIIVLDDVTDLAALPLPPSWATKTSPGNHQVGYLCESLLSPRQAEQIGQGLMLRVGADPSGWDAAQLIRLAGTLNTKLKCAGRPGNPDQGFEPEGWPVRLVRDDGPRYAIEHLAAVALPGGMHDLVRGCTAHQKRRAERHGPDEDDPDRPWRNAAYRDAFRAAADRIDVARLLDKHGLPRGLTPRQPGYAVLMAHQRGEIMYRSPSGNWDASRERWAVIGSLLRVGYNQAEVAALARELAAFGEEVKGSAAIWEDIIRVIVANVAELGDAYKPRRPEPSDDSPMAGCADRPTLPHRRPGRPIGQRAQTASKLLRLLREQAGQIITRTHLAQALAVTKRTITSHLAQLEQDGMLQITREARGLRVEVNSLAPIRGTPQEDPLQHGVVTVEHNSPYAEGVEGRSFAPFAASECGSDSVGDHTRPVSPPCTLPADPPAPDASTASALHLVEPALPSANTAPPEAAPAARCGVCPPADPPVVPTEPDQATPRRWEPVPLTPAERAHRERQIRRIHTPELAPPQPVTESERRFLDRLRTRVAPQPSPPANPSAQSVSDRLRVCSDTLPSLPEDRGTDTTLEPPPGRGAWFDPTVRADVPARVARDGPEALAQLYEHAEKLGLPNFRPPSTATIATLPEPEPLRRGPPRTPERLREYHKLLGKAKKTHSAKQRAWLLAEAAKLEEIYTPEQWQTQQQGLRCSMGASGLPAPQMSLWEADQPSVTHHTWNEQGAPMRTLF